MTIDANSRDKGDACAAGGGALARIVNGMRDPGPACSCGARHAMTSALGVLVDHDRNPVGIATLRELVLGHVQE